MFFLDMQNKIGFLFGCEITICAFEHWLLSGRSNLSCHLIQTSHSSNRIVSSWNTCQGAYGNYRNTSPDPCLLGHLSHCPCVLSWPLFSAIHALDVIIKEPLNAFFTPVDCHVTVLLPWYDRCMYKDTMLFLSSCKHNPCSYLLSMHKYLRYSMGVKCS